MSVSFRCPLTASVENHNTATAQNRNACSYLCTSISYSIRSFKIFPQKNTPSSAMNACSLLKVMHKTLLKSVHNLSINCLQLLKCLWIRRKGLTSLAQCDKSFGSGSLSHTTMSSVAMGSNTSERKNQFIPLRFFPWASPALISANVPHPTAYSFSKINHTSDPLKSK